MNLPQPFHLMAKPVGGRCNIDCRYCYYLDKTELFPGEKKFLMSEAVLERYVSQLVETALKAGQVEVLFAWHGGEPMMAGLEFYRRAIQLQQKIAPENLTVENSMQTNATLIDNDWAAFLASNDFLVGVSIDGPKSIHDKYRIDRAGRPTFDATMAGIKLLQDHGVSYNLLTVVHADNAEMADEVYGFLRELGTPHLQFIPIVERAAQGGNLAAAPQIDMDKANEVTPWSVSPTAYGTFLGDVFDAWYRSDVGRIHVQHFEIHLGMALGYPSSLCVFAETCGDALVLEHNGDVFACDHYVYPQFNQGNIAQSPLDELVWSGQMEKFGSDKTGTLTAQCQRCNMRRACSGGCPKHRFAVSEDGEPGHSYFCQSYQMFMRHAGPRIGALAQMVRSGRPASDIYKTG